MPTGRLSWRCFGVTIRACPLPKEERRVRTIDVTQLTKTVVTLSPLGRRMKDSNGNLGPFKRISNVVRMIDGAVLARWSAHKETASCILPPTMTVELDPFKYPPWTDSREVPPASITENYVALIFFSPKAFQFYLPAYMTYVLKHLDPQQAVVGRVVHHVCLATSPIPNFAQEIAVLRFVDARAERQVLAFLETIRDHVDVSDLRREAASGVRDYWQRFQ